jgi:eukaryotic-like serine/threonine-protein kinase
MPQSQRLVFSFPPFRLDPSRRLLTRDEQTISLTPKEFDTLVVLVEAAGRVVDKEELMSRVWRDSYVGDGSLARNISVLRKTLGVDVIQTHRGQGYRIALPVMETTISPIVVPPEPLPKREATTPRPGGEAAIQEASRRWRPRAIFGSAKGPVLPILLVFAAAVFTGYLLLRRPANLAKKDTIILTDFTNTTDDPVFDGALRQGLSVQLEQSPFLNLLSDERIAQTLSLMNKPKDTRLSPAVAREVCQRNAATAVLEGSIAQVGTQYLVTLKAVNCSTGESLASTEVQPTDKNHVLDALGECASAIRVKLGESLATVQKFNTPLEQATTSSLEALRAFSLGQEERIAKGDDTAAIPLLKEAIRLDPNFAMAYFAMSDSYSVIGETTASTRYMQRAFELREKITEREKLFIEGFYYYYVPGDLVKAQHSLDLLSKLYPDSSDSHIGLATISNMLGQYETGLAEYRAALNLDPSNSSLQRHLVLTYLLLNRAEEAAAVANEVNAKRLGADLNLAPLLYTIAFFRSDPAEMARQVAGGTSKRREEDLLWGLESDTAAYFGHLKKALELSRRAADSAERAGEQETAATYYAVSALREALFGNVYEARQQATTARRHSSGRDMDYGVALALAYAGDTRRAQALADDLAKRFPEDTIVKLNYVPALRAKIAICHSKPQQALDILQAGVPYELGLPAYSFYNWPNLYPVFVRGEAYLAAHRGGEAADEFQTILDHRGIVLNEPISSLAHLQLGRAYAMVGDTAKAKTSYQDFLTLWKDADPDIPILRQARAEYAKLQ